MMQEELRRLEPKEPAFCYHTDHCRSREQSRACTSFAETRQCRRSQHLGSTSHLVDDRGNITQTLAYMPYGEDWMEYSHLDYSDTSHLGVYQFNVAEVESRASLLALPRCSNVIADNGKERDFESGFYYYGARYYWPELWTGWTSPDPLMDKYPGISPYNYCNWNPVVFIDPVGLDTAFAGSAERTLYHEYRNQVFSDSKYVNTLVSR